MCKREIKMALELEADVPVWFDEDFEDAIEM